MPGVELESSPCGLPRVEDINRGDWGKGEATWQEPRKFRMRDSERFIKTINLSDLFDFSLSWLGNVLCRPFLP